MLDSCRSVLYENILLQKVTMGGLRHPTVNRWHDRLERQPLLVLCSVAAKERKLPQVIRVASLGKVIHGVNRDKEGGQTFKQY